MLNCLKTWIQQVCLWLVLNFNNSPPLYLHSFFSFASLNIDALKQILPGRERAFTMLLPCIIHRDAWSQILLSRSEFQQQAFSVSALLLQIISSSFRFPQFPLYPSEFTHLMPEGLKFPPSPCLSDSLDHSISKYKNLSPTCPTFRGPTALPFQ